MKRYQIGSTASSLLFQGWVEYKAIKKKKMCKKQHHTQYLQDDSPDLLIFTIKHTNSTGNQELIGSNRLLYII